MKDCQLEDKFCYLKNKLTYPNKNIKIIFLYFFFLKEKQEISFPGNQVESEQTTLHYLLKRFRCDVFRIGF